MYVSDKELCPADTDASVGSTIEIHVKGKWFTVPAVPIDGRSIILKGKWVKVAVVHDEEWLERGVEDPERYLTTIRNAASDGFRGDIFTFSQKLPATDPKYSYSVEWDSVATVRTTSFKEWWEGLPQETRKNVRRSQKRGVNIIVKGLDDDLIRGIMGVNDDSPLRQGRPNVHYGKSFDQVRKDQSSFLDRSDYVCAVCDGELIGFLKVVYCGQVASILNLVTKASESDKRPANALVAKAVELCEARGMSYLTYGLFNYGNKRHSPLREFKIRNGFGETLVPRYYVPLTTWGRFCIKLKLHRGLLGILPPRAISFGNTVRARIATSRCSSNAERPRL
jgi:hypothetical protein